jgi:hypothetical protein
LSDLRWNVNSIIIDWNGARIRSDRIGRFRQACIIRSQRSKGITAFPESTEAVTLIKTRFLNAAHRYYCISPYVNLRVVWGGGSGGRCLLVLHREQKLINPKRKRSYFLICQTEIGMRKSIWYIESERR